MHNRLATEVKSFLGVGAFDHLEWIYDGADLNSFSDSGGGNLKKNFPKIQMPVGLPGGCLR